MSVVFETGWLCLNCGHKHHGETEDPCPKCHVGPSIRAVIREPEEAKP
jgi:rubrerythrin